jgi:Flp pilus assembly pilin Flp
MLRRLRSQAGQTASEYMGVLLVVAAIVAAITASPLAGQIANRTKELICKIGGFDCSAATQQALSQCVVAESSDKLTINGSVNVRLVKVKLEGGVEYVRQKRADGTVAVTLKLPLSGGVGPALAKALGIGKLDGTVKVGSVPQVTFLLADDAAANKFAQQIKDSAIAAAAGPILSHFIGKSIHIDIPPVESLAYEVNAGVDLSYSIDGAGGYAKGSLSALNTLGIKHNVTSGKPNSGDTTVYYRYNGTAGLDGGLLLGEGFGGALAGDMTLAVTIGSNGKLKTLSLIGTGSYQGKVALKGKFTDLAGALHGIDALDINASAGEGQKAQFQIDLPLDNPDVQAAAAQFLQGVNPLTGSPASRVAAAGQLWDAIKRNAKVEVRTYDTHSSSTGVNIDAVVAGGGVNFDTTGSDLTSALDYVPGVGFVPSATCHK